VKVAAWFVLGIALFGWILWLAAMDAVQRNVSFEEWLKERLNFARGMDE
jgi:hypothetical protein